VGAALARGGDGLRRISARLGPWQRDALRIMAYLVDTNVLARLANTADAQHVVASQAVMELHRRGEVLHVTPQVLIEFRNVATRPIAQNGLGLSAVDAEAKAAVFEATFPLLVETADIYPAWKALVGALGVLGKQVHDARLVAICHVHAVRHLLTSNVSHFVRMAGFGPGVVVVDAPSV
jgi:predicted nucleic acid-binding protein